MRHEAITQENLLSINHLDVDTLGGRALFRDLNLSMGFEQMALIGRNGVGKTTLLETIAAAEQASGGQVRCYSEPLLVAQTLSSEQPPADHVAELFFGLDLFKLNIDARLSEIGLPPYNDLLTRQGFSRGELRKLHLLNVLLRQPDLLLLDEPGEDLDDLGFNWLCSWLGQWQKGLIIISHDPRLLGLFSSFCLISESGCRYFNTRFDQLETLLEDENTRQQKQYLRQINQLTAQEAHNRQVNCRRQQKKNQGRLREIGRATPKVRLNSKRGYAQQSQAKVAKIRQDRIAAVRTLVKDSRRALDVVLPMELVLPELPPMDGSLTVDLENISKAGLFSDLTLKVKRERIAIVGPNGSGKSTLLNIVMQNIAADEGTVAVRRDKVGYIAQGGSNWMLTQSLVEHMLHLSQDMTPQRVMELLIAFKFPLALAERSMRSLTPGERARAALLCLMVKQPCVECLVLDEPSNGLDFLAAKALQQSLKAWTGGFIIAGHDRAFFEAIGVDRVISL
ncbi:MAG: ABC-F family ATP-binding cassette domain-containing protein [Algicola sp.]|nr:ABC-F family ATP-binding cassette domain-containing protein [Algicola sp.]